MADHQAAAWCAKPKSKIKTHFSCNTIRTKPSPIFFKRLSWALEVCFLDSIAEQLSIIMLKLGCSESSLRCFVEQMCGLVSGLFVLVWEFWMLVELRSFVRVIYGFMLGPLAPTR